MLQHAMVLSVLLGCLLSAGPAHADLVPPDLEPCAEKKVGDTCTYAGKTGVCEKSTCYRNDYSDGPPPKSVPYPCVRCVTPPAPTKGSALPLPIELGAGGVALLAGILLARRLARRR